MMILGAALLAATLSSGDETYLRSTMQNQLARYAIGDLAEKRATTPQLRSLAASVAAQAEDETRKLDAMAKQDGVKPPSEPGTRDLYHYSQLSQDSGTAFDSQFVTDLKIDDEIVSENDQTEMQSGQDAKLRNLAKKRYEELKREEAKLNRVR